MSDIGAPQGQLFSEIYCERGDPEQDSIRFRNRIGYYCQAVLNKHHTAIARTIKLRTGASVQSNNNYNGVFYRFEDHFRTIDLRDLKDTITLVYRAVNNEVRGNTDHLKWRQFVRTALHQENLGYRLDEGAGMHYLYDQEFEHNRATALRALDGQRYTGVRSAFDDAFRHLDSDPVDTKAAVRSIFESLEIQVRQMVGGKNLNKWALENSLQSAILPLYNGDETAQVVVKATLDGLGLWIDGLHSYRHGQAQQEPVAPPLDLAVYTLSNGAAFLRWLLETDMKIQNRNSVVVK